MSLRVKRGAKAAALKVVAMNNSAVPDSLGSAALRMMKIDLQPGLATKYYGGAKAAACVSVDFDVTTPERFPWNHEGTEALLHLSEAHGLPLTWAICGKTAVEDRQAYESILGSSVKQEIGVHTYSHIYADETTEEAYEADVEKCIEVLQISTRPTTFVFPKNREGHFNLLKRMGFTSYRGKQRGIGAPKPNEGLWNIMPVYYVDPKSLDASGLIKRFIDVCVARSAVFHLWTHPWSLAIDGRVEKMASDVMEPVFQHMEEKSRSGLLSLATMGTISQFMGSPS